MSETIARRPDPSEYAAFYAGYVAAVPEEDVLQVLRGQRVETLELLRGLPPGRTEHRYEPGKWSLAEVVGHVVDAERIFAYRGLRFARGDGTPLPGMDQDEYVLAAGFGRRSFDSLLDEYDHQRQASCALFESFDQELLDRRGEASGFDFSVRALIYIVAGHERHHVEVLRSRYLG